MKTSEELRQIVKEKYGEIAEKAAEKKSCGCCKQEVTDNIIFSIKYAKLEGYNPEADLKLGCGLPTEYARIKKGDTVIDLGSGAGNDCFVARALTGENGRVIGLDFTEKMVEKARINAAKLGYKNIDFQVGEIEDMPIADNYADVVISNCVMNLVPSKEKAFAETYRILKPGGHFSISDIVLEGNLPEDLREEAALYAGCISGAVQKDQYIRIIQEAGFKNIKIQSKQENELPDEVYLNYLTPDEWEKYKESGSGIYSITIYAEK